MRFGIAEEKIRELKCPLYREESDEFHIRT
jgi:hypothetical protein